VAYQIAINIDADENWAGMPDQEARFDYLRAADEAGVHSVWVAETWSRDPVPFMTQIAERTKSIQIASGIMNVFGRSPGLIAQTFATLDAISGGRMIIGLGISAPAVIEHFHGVEFKAPLQRTREYVEIIRMLLSGERLNYEGSLYHLERGFSLPIERQRDQIPIFVASLGPKSVAQAAEIADGWMPLWTPIQDLPALVERFRGTASEAGRAADPPVVRSPGTLFITDSAKVEQTRQGQARKFAYYVSRMGDAYYQHVSRLGYSAEADAIRAGFNSEGSTGGTAAVPPELQQELCLVTDSTEAGREWLAEQDEAGVAIHLVKVDAASPAEASKTYERLIG